LTSAKAESLSTSDIYAKEYHGEDFENHEEDLEEDPEESLEISDIDRGGSNEAYLATLKTRSLTVWPRLL
jgi:hypothetical protein